MYKSELDELQRHLLNHIERLAADPFSVLSRVSVGFENIFDEARAAGNQDLRFPFHNLERVEDGYLLHFTLAGWSQDEVKVGAEENKITISGEPTQNGEGETLHQGITKKAFKRIIIVRPGLEVALAWMENGLLTIKLVKPEPVSNMKEIPIVRGAPSASDDAVGLGEVPKGSELLVEEFRASR